MSLESTRVAGLRGGGAGARSGGGPGGYGLELVGPDEVGQLDGVVFVVAHEVFKGISA